MLIPYTIEIRDQRPLKVGFGSSVVFEPMNRQPKAPKHVLQGKSIATQSPPKKGFNNWNRVWGPLYYNYNKEPLT